MNHVLLPTIQVTAVSSAGRRMKKMVVGFLCVLFFFSTPKIFHADPYYLSLKNKSQNTK